MLGLALLLSGCTPDAEPAPVRPIAAAKQAHPGIVDSDFSSHLSISLRSNEPTGTAPFAVLAAMVESDPGLGTYSVSYAMLRSPDRRFNGYGWNVAEQTVIWTREQSNGPHGVIAQSSALASGIDTDTLSAIAAGTLPMPTFRSTVNASDQ
jgi:hypothetical protein